MSDLLHILVVARHYRDTYLTFHGARWTGNGQALVQLGGSRGLLQASQLTPV